MKRGLLAGVAALAVGSAASAGFVGISVESHVIDGKSVFRVFAQFDSADDVVLSVFGVNGIPASGFFHSDLAGGSWAPQFTIGSDAATDSFVTIGGAPGFTQPGIPDNAGWFNSNPPNLQGKVDPNTLKTLIAQFSFDGPITAFSTPFTVAYNQGLGTPTVFGEGFPFVPAPGALVVVIAGIVAARRRRI